MNTKILEEIIMNCEKFSNALQGQTDVTFLKETSYAFVNYVKGLCTGATLNEEEIK